MPIPLASWSKAYVWGRLLAGTGVSNTANARVSISYECCLLSGRGLCDGPIPRPEDSYRVCMCHWVWLGTTVTPYTYCTEKVQEVRLGKKEYHRVNQFRVFSVQLKWTLKYKNIIIRLITAQSNYTPTAYFFTSGFAITDSPSVSQSASQPASQSVSQSFSQSTDHEFIHACFIS